MIDTVVGDTEGPTPTLGSWEGCVPFTADSKPRAPVCAYVRFTPQDEDLCHHAEELVRVCIGAFEPVRSEAKDK